MWRAINLIGSAGGLGGVPRRRLLQGAGALGLAVTLRPTAVFADCDDDNERLGPFGPWSTPVNLGPVVNTPFDDNHPAISKNGLSLYITSNRPGGVNGKTFTGLVTEEEQQMPVRRKARNGVVAFDSIDDGHTVERVQIHWRAPIRVEAGAL